MIRQDVLSSECPDLVVICEAVYNLQIEHSPADAALVNAPGSDGLLADTVNATQYPFPFDPDRRHKLAAGYTKNLALLGALSMPLSSAGQQVYSRMADALTARLDLMQNTDYLRPVDHNVTSLPQAFAHDLDGGGRYPIRSRDDLDAAVYRAHGFGAWVTQALVSMREGMRTGYGQPQFVLEAALAKQESLLKPGKLDALLVKPLAGIPDISNHDGQKYVDTMRGLVGTGYEELVTGIRDILPAARSDDQPGLCYIQSGPEEYERLLRHWFGENISPPDLQAEMKAGYRETAGQLDAIAHGLGHTTIQSLFNYMDNDRSLRPFTTVKEIHDCYAEHREIIRQHAGTIIAVGPEDLDYDIHVLETGQREPSYTPGSPDGRRKGVMNIYVGDPSAYPLPPMILHSLHEGFGHHVQTVQQQRTPLPPFLRTFAVRPESREGWAMYVEQFAQELGFEADRYTQAIQLERRLNCYRGMILDLGIHTLGWSVAEARQARRAMNGDEGLESETADILRFTAWPGQVGAYDAGNRISNLQKEAAANVPGFSLAAFNTMIIASR